MERSPEGILMGICLTKLLILTDLIFQETEEKKNLSRDWKISFHFVYMETNICAHMLAQLSHRISNEFCAFEQSLPSINVFSVNSRKTLYIYYRLKGIKTIGKKVYGLSQKINSNTRQLNLYLWSCYRTYQENLQVIPQLNFVKFLSTSQIITIGARPTITE